MASVRRMPVLLCVLSWLNAAVGVTRRDADEKQAV